LIISTFSFFGFALAGWFCGANPLDCSTRALAAGVGVYFISRFYSKLAEKVMMQEPSQVGLGSNHADGDVNEKSGNQ